MGERRVRERFVGDIAAIAKSSSSDSRSFAAVGEIIDINMEGCSLLHMINGCETSSITELAIFAYERPFVELVKLPCSVVYDTQVAKLPFSPITARRCGIKFGELTDIQRARLSQILDNYTHGEPSVVRFLRSSNG